MAGDATAAAEKPRIEDLVREAGEAAVGAPIDLDDDPEEGEAPAGPKVIPNWAVFPEGVKLPVGWQVWCLRFPGNLTNTPGKGDRTCILWNLSEADEKHAAKRARGDGMRVIERDGQADAPGGRRGAGQLVGREGPGIGGTSSGPRSGASAATDQEPVPEDPHDDPPGKRRFFRTWRRCQDGYLTGRGRPFPPDPDAVEDALDKLVASRGFDATLLGRLTPEEVLENRLRMKMALARYARIDPFRWEDRDVVEMRDAYEILVDMLKNESASATEDR